MLAIRIFRDKTFLRTIRLEPEVTYIGRMPENHIVIDDPKASRSHARIIHRGGNFTVEDQQSENGIFVNGKKADSHVLKVGDKIGIGNYIMEVVAAGEDAVPAQRQLEETEEEWRMDQTISTTTEKLQARVRGKVTESKPLPIQTQTRAGDLPKTSKLPSMNFTLKIGDASYTESVTFDKARKRLPEDGEGNLVEVRVRIGKWILDKKIPI